MQKAALLFSNKGIKQKTQLKNYHLNCFDIIPINRSQPKMKFNTNKAMAILNCFLGNDTTIKFKIIQIQNSALPNAPIINK